jgi:hypothetical protein
MIVDERINKARKENINKEYNYEDEKLRDGMKRNTQRYEDVQERKKGRIKISRK